MNRLEAFLRKAKKYNFCSPSVSTFEILFDAADQKLFNKVISERNHVLQPMLPPKVNYCYNLRRRPHDFVLPVKKHKLYDCNFLVRLLFKDCY